MGHLKDTVPHLQSDSELGLQEWASREMQLFESLRAEQFLRARQSLIVMRKETVEATKTLAETWRAFDETNSALNAELVKSSTEFKNKLTEWAVMAGNGADLLGQVIGGGSAALSSVLTVIKNVGKNAKELRPVLEAAHMKMQAKQPEWDVLKKLNDSQKEVLERIDPSLIERHLNEARFDDVSASQDFQQFRDGAMQAVAEHAKAALSAEYHSAAAGKFADRSSSTMENITQLDELGRRWKEFDEIQRSLADGALKSMVRRKNIHCSSMLRTIGQPVLSLPRKESTQGKEDYKPFMASCVYPDLACFVVEGAEADPEIRLVTGIPGRKHKRRFVRGSRGANFPQRRLPVQRELLPMEIAVIVNA